MNKKLSKIGFRVGLVLSIGSMTLHDLFHSWAFQGMSSSLRKRIIKSSLEELCERNLLTWTYEPDYGNKKGIIPKFFGKETFLRFWNAHIKVELLDFEIPDKNNPTFFFDPTVALYEEIDKDIYDIWKNE